MNGAKKLIYLLSGLLLLVSCKATKKVSEGDVDGSLSTKRIIERHYQNELDFETLRGRIKIDYDDGDTSQGFTVNLRLKKDETIWISSSPISVVKAIITPNRVSFYNRLQNEYFDGDFSYLSKLLGTDLDFEKVQNLLLGNAVLDLRKERYDLSVEKEGYRLEPRKANELYKILFLIEPKYYKTANQEIAQPWENRSLKIQYRYQELGKKVLPKSIKIEATNKREKTNIDLEYRGMEFGKQFNFPYKIPKGFKEIVLE